MKQRLFIVFLVVTNICGADSESTLGTSQRRATWSGDSKLKRQTSKEELQDAQQRYKAPGERQGSLKDFDRKKRSASAALVETK